MNHTIRNIAGALAVIGALNWGLVAIARFDLVAEIFGMEFGETNAATRVIYGLVGLAGLVLAISALMSARHIDAGERREGRTGQLAHH